MLLSTLTVQPVVDRIRCDRGGERPEVLRRRTGYASELLEAPVREGGLLAGIGFTMALFIANLAFSPEWIGQAKLGIFAASLVSVAAALLLLSALSRHPRQTHPDV
jgi:hypothetical protein